MELNGLQSKLELLKGYRTEKGKQTRDVPDELITYKQLKVYICSPTLPSIQKSTQTDISGVDQNLIIVKKGSEEEIFKGDLRKHGDSVILYPLAIYIQDKQRIMLLIITRIFLMTGPITI